MKNWKKITVIAIGTILVLSILSYNARKGKTEDFETHEPTEAQLALLEEVYNEFEDFEFIPDRILITWEGPYREKFEQLCGRKLDLEITFEKDYYQSPNQTLKRKGGDCEDFAILFVSAAKNLRISARVVEGRVQRPEDPESIDHVWAEIYYQGKWRIVDPGLVVEKINAPFRRFVDYPEKYPVVKIRRKYDDKIIEGVVPREYLEFEKSKCQKEVFNFLLNVFGGEKKREPFENELKEISEITDNLVDLIEKEWIAWPGIPEDPRALIQPDNHEVRIWIERIGSKANG